MEGPVLKTRFLLVLGLLLALAPVPALADTITLAAVGDSLAAPYAGHKGTVNPLTGFPFWGEAGDKSWTEQLQTVRPAQLAVVNQARAGATTTELIAQGQHTAVADMVRQGKVRHAVVTVGTNDVLLALRSDAAPTKFISDLAANLNAVVRTIATAGDVGLVLGNIPNLSIAPAIRAMAGNSAEALGMIRDMVQTANREIARVAAENRVPLVDLFRLSNLASKPPVLGGTQLESSHFYAADMLHPSTLSQGLMVNTIFEALERGYGFDFAALRLSNEEILRLSKLPYDPNSRTFYDVSSYVVMPPAHDTPEPSTLALCAVAGIVGLGRWGCRRFRQKAA